MAKGKRRRGSGAAKPSKQAENARAPDAPREAGVPPSRSDRFTFAEYMVAIFIFWLFIGGQFLVTWLWTGETIGMNYFFLSLGIGFTVVAVFSWLHDMFYREGPTETQSSA